MTLDLDIADLRRWIGREECNHETVTPELVQRFNATFDRTSSVDIGAEAPLLIHFCLTQPTVPTAELGQDGHPERGGFLPPVPLPRRMWAGGGIQFHAPIRIGDQVSRRSVIDDVTVKEGRSGTLCFVTVTHHIASQGILALTERQDIVYRAAESATINSVGSNPAKPALQNRKITASAPFLFRYSALTFNGHRIHYDAPYTRSEEGYPGLIIHGPMQATLLCQYASDLRHAAPKSFEFRSVSPIFDTDDFTINAQQDGDTLSLWTARLGGPIAMKATARW